MMMNPAINRSAGFFLAAILLMATSGCGSDATGENIGVGEPTRELMACYEARSFVHVLDYLVREGKTDEIAPLFDKFGYLFAAEYDASIFGRQQETFEAMRDIVNEIRPTLLEGGDISAVQPEIDRLKELSESMPGDEIKLAEVWTVE